MGFPFEEASWSVVEGAMYMGAGGPATLLYTLISAGLCVWALWSGHRKEHALYENYK